MENYESVSVKGRTISERDGTRSKIQFSTQDITASELINQLSAHYTIRDLEVGAAGIETTFRRIYEDQLLDQTK
jgi:ABC-type uncharacterized transport system ATPase subunit